MVINKETKTIQSVGRALSILQCFKNGEELTVSRISGELNLNVTTTFHILNTLKQCGFIQQNQTTKTYSLDVEVFRLGYAYLNGLDIVKVARPYLEYLCQKSNETVHLAEIYNNQVLYLDKIESHQSIGMRSQVGSSKPLYCTGIGKILLAYQDIDAIDNYLETIEMIPHTGNTIDDPQLLKQALALYREQGYAVDNEEVEIGLYCLAVPIFDISNKNVAAISIAAPRGRLEPQNAKIIPLLKKSALEISQKLGFTP